MVHVLSLCVLSLAAASSVPARAQPNLVRGADGVVYLSWVETAASGESRLQSSAWRDGHWSAPRTVASGTDWFVNWADFPSLAALEDGTLAAHWLQKSGPATYAYDVRLSLSTDAGRTWSDPVSPHRDGTQTEHGFVSLVPLNKTTFGVFWLDGRAMAKDDGDMSLRFTTLSRDGRFGAEVLVDDRVCECCQTGAVPLGGDRAAVVYRDRSDDEIRDVRLAIVQAGQPVQKSRLVHPDGWEIEGCPVNGPVIRRSEEACVVVWPTGAGGRMQIRTRFFTGPDLKPAQTVMITTVEPLGRVDAVMVDARTAIVSWLETSGGEAEIRWCRVHADGTTGPAESIARTRGTRASGFPHIVLDRQTLHFAWTVPGQPTRVRTATRTLRNSAAR